MYPIVLDTMTHFLILRNLNFDISHILRLENLHNIGRKRFIPTITNGHPSNRLSLDHPKVELILVTECSLLFQLSDPIFLRFVVSSSMNIVLVLFQ